MSARVLIIEDDARLAELFAELLGAEGYTVDVEHRGDTGAERILADPPDLVLLDIGLPGEDGFGVCRRVRAAYPGRILVITARGDELDEVLGLELGADDYVTKPVAARRLIARVRNLLRRPAAPADDVLRLGPLVVDPGRRRAELDGEALALTTSEFELLLVLARRAGRVTSREELYEALRGGGYDGLDRSIDLRVSRLRRHLGDDPRTPTWIKTVHGVGYLLAPPG